MRTTRLFSVVEEGKEIFKGSALEVQKHLNIPSKDIIYAYARYGHKLYGIYSFIPAGVRKSEGNKKTLEKMEKAKPKPTKHQQKVEYLAWHLLYRNGITTIKGNPQEYVEDLKKLGIDITYRKYDKKDYIVERI